MSSNIEIEKTCQWCGKRFIARTTVTAYCSHRCSGLAYKELKRQKKVEQCKEEQKRVQTGQAEIQEKEFLSPRDAAQLVGVCYKTFYNYINNGSIKTWKMKRKTLVRRVDVEDLFTASPERLTVEKEEKAITDFYTTQEVLEKYKLSNGWFWKVAKEQKFPKTVYRGKNLWSKAHVDRFFGKKSPVDDIEDWYTVPEIQDKFGMTLSAIYNHVSKNGIPKKKFGKTVKYSKNHFDVSKGIAEPEPPKDYTYVEAMEKFGMTRDQLHHYIKRYNIPRVKKGKFTYISRKELDDLLAPPSI